MSPRNRSLVSRDVAPGRPNHQQPIYYCEICNRALSLKEAVEAYVESNGQLVHHGHAIRRIPKLRPEKIHG